MPLTAAKGAKKKADDLFSKIVRSRGSCVRCGSTYNLQTCHIISRRFSATRCDLTNALCGCASCHRFWTDNPVAFATFLFKNVMTEEEWCALNGRSLSRAKVDWDAEVERLKPILASVSQ